MRRLALVALLVAPLAVALVVAGCGPSGGGTPRAAVAPVTCDVSVNGQPLAKGSLLFVPDRSKNTKGRAAHGTVANGKVAKLTTYDDGDGAIVGHHKVEIHSMKGDDPQTAKDIVPPQYNTNTTLTVEVKADAKNNFKFEMNIPGYKPE